MDEEYGKTYGVGIDYDIPCKECGELHDSERAAERCCLTDEQIHAMLIDENCPCCIALRDEMLAEAARKREAARDRNFIIDHGLDVSDADSGL